MSEVLKQYDAWLAADGPVALVIQEELLPVLGKETPVFPPTFAPPEGSKDGPNYVIDELSDGKAAIIDTVGSQANRLEPIFKSGRYAALVPQVKIRIGEREMDLLDAGHRAGDAVIRYSKDGDKFQQAFAAYQMSGDAEKLGQLSPTSIVFGVWDSRGTQAKLPRLVSSTVRATKVERLRRSAQYMSSLTKEEQLEVSQKKELLSENGLADAPSGLGPGGVIVKGEILREAVLNLVALRALKASTPERSEALRRYILGLSLVAFAAPAQLYLRQGCLLTSNPENPAKVQSVERTGKRVNLEFSEAGVAEYAEAAAAAFGVGQGLETSFDVERARKSKKEAAKGGKATV